LTAAVGLVCAYDPDVYRSLLGKLAQDELVLKDFVSNVRDLLTIDPNYFNYKPFTGFENFTFHCDPVLFKSEQIPDSVHKLRPGDVRVVGAMGDSITAGVGTKATTILGMLVEFRGK
jgi:hypothetical protein